MIITGFAFEWICIIAVNEVIAESFDDCFGKSEALSEFAKEHRSTVEKIFEGIRDILSKIINAVKKFAVGANSKEAKLVEWCENKQKLYDTMLRQALENSYAAVGEGDMTAENKNAPGDAECSKGHSATK